MAFVTSLRYRSPDSSSLVNTRFKDVFRKGFSNGANVTLSGVSLQVTVSDFVLVNFDGMVVVSDAPQVLTVTDAVNNYVCFRARYIPLQSPLLQFEVMSAAAYGADPDQDHLHVICRVDLTSGGPHAFPPASSLHYDVRDALDKQGRSFFRDPVPNAGALPIPPYATADLANRVGDIRLVLATGSFYRWNGTAWQVLDEVPLQFHRDTEHHNGIIGEAPANTLEPTAVGTTITMQSGGGGYTVDGMYLAIPAGVTSITGASVGTTRGLVQLAVNNVGVPSATYRITKDVDPLDIAAARIVDISDNHPLGATSLVFQTGPDRLSWAGGAPVSVVTGNRYRLTDNTGLHWIDVVLTGALPGAPVNDGYTVLAGKRTDTDLLVGHYFWDGAATLVLGADKRQFGNLSGPQISDAYREQEYLPPWDDLRGDMVYEGGDLEEVSPPSLTLRIYGPIVAYIQGRRILVPGSYAGIVMPASSTRYLYVDQDGVLQISATDPTVTAPAAGPHFAQVGVVVTNPSQITLIEDRRDPQVIIGNATRFSRLRFTAGAELRHNPALTRFDFLSGGALTGTTVNAGEYYSEDDTFIGSDAVGLVSDNYGTRVNVMDPNHDNVETLQPKAANPSLLGAISGTQSAHVSGVGVDFGIGNRCAPSAGATTITIDTGVFYDFQGREVTLDAPEVVTLTTDGTHTIAWNSETRSFVSGTTVYAEWRNHIPFAVAVRAGGIITSMFDCRIAAGGHNCQLGFTVGTKPDTLSGFKYRANFQSIKAALVFMAQYVLTDNFVPRRLLVNDFVSMGNSGLVSSTDTLFKGNFDVCSGLQVEGLMSGANQDIPTLAWGEAAVASTSPAFDFGNAIRGVQFRNLRIRYDGITGVDSNNCFVKNPNTAFVVDGCRIHTNGGTAGDRMHTFLTYTSGGFGGVTTNIGTSNQFSRCNFTSAVLNAVTATNAVAITGRLVIDGCNFDGATGTGENIVSIANAGSSPIIHLRECTVRSYDFLATLGGSPTDFVARDCFITEVGGQLFTTPGAGILLIEGGELGMLSIGANIAGAKSVDLVNVTVTASLNAFGARSFRGCRLVGGSTIDASSDTTGVDVINCDFQADGFFHGYVGTVSASRLALPSHSTNVLIGVPSGVTIIDGCDITKSVSGSVSPRVMSMPTSLASVALSQSRLTIAGTTTSAEAVVDFHATNASMDRCRITRGVAGTNAPSVVSTNATAVGFLALSNNNIEVTGTSTSTAPIINAHAIVLRMDGNTVNALSCGASLAIGATVSAASGPYHISVTNNKVIGGRSLAITSSAVSVPDGRVMVSGNDFVNVGSLGAGTYVVDFNIASGGNFGAVDYSGNRVYASTSDLLRAHRIANLAVGRNAFVTAATSSAIVIGSASSSPGEDQVNVSVNDNTLRHSGTSIPGVPTSSFLQVDKYRTTVVSNNSIERLVLTDGDVAGALQSYISVQPPNVLTLAPTVMISNNTILLDKSAASSTNCSAYITVPNSTIRAASITGNTIYVESQGTGAALAEILIFDATISSHSITGNSIRAFSGGGSEAATISCGANSGTVVGNTVSAPGGTMSISGISLTPAAGLPADGVNRLA